MTNLIAALVITVSTNWTGAGDDTREVGVIVTNFEAQCVLENKTNTFLLQKKFADVVAWRQKQPVYFNTMTNIGIYNMPYSIRLN